MEYLENFNKSDTRGVYDELVDVLTSVTNNLQKKMMLEYLAEHFNEITLEDLETIIKNK